MKGEIGGSGRDEMMSGCKVEERRDGDKGKEKGIGERGLK